MRRLWVSLLGVIAASLLLAVPAAANSPSKQAFGPVHVVFPDFFSGADSPHCNFAVVGDWQAHGWTETFTNNSGVTVRIEAHIWFAGTLSNPLTGKSVPDMGHMEVTDYFASDGSFIKETEQGSRTGFLRAAFHTVTDSQGNIVVDVGRDWLLTAKHPVSIAPVCSALS